MAEAGFEALGDLPARARILLAGLVEKLLDMQTDEHLYTSFRGDPTVSVTVSAMVMMAFHEARHPHAQYVCDAILSMKVKDHGMKGAFPAQVGGYCHTYGTAWALSSCLRVRPSCVYNLFDTVSWLTAQRRQGVAGWGHTREHQPRPFFSAYVVNALIEYLDCLLILGGSADALPRKVRKTVEEGINFLKDGRIGANINPFGNNLLLWSFDSKDKGVCLASTTNALHALSRFFYGELGRHRADAPGMRAAIKETYEALGGVLAASTLQENIAALRVGQQSLTVNLWPTIKEDSPKTYTNLFFTPFAAVSLMEVCRLLYPDALPALRPEILTLVRWIYDNAYYYEGSLEGIIGPGERVYVWSTAKAATVLSLWLNSLQQVIFQPDKYLRPGPSAAGQTLAGQTTNPAASHP